MAERKEGEIMTVRIELKTWQVAILEGLVRRAINDFQDTPQRAYAKDLGGLLNILTLAREQANAKI